MATLPGKSCSPGSPHVWCFRLPWWQPYQKELFSWLSTCVVSEVILMQLYREKAVLLALNMYGVWGYFDSNFTGKELFSWLSTCVVFEVIFMATLPGKSCSPGSPHVWCLRLSWWQLYRERAVFLAHHMCGVWGYFDCNVSGKELFSWVSKWVVSEVILMATLPGKSCSPGSPHVWCLRLFWWQLYRERAVLLAPHMCCVWGYFDGNYTGKELFSWRSTCVVFEAILMATLPGKSCFPGSPHVWCLRLS